MRSNKQQLGFSLMEVLVVLAIFTVTITLALDLFLTLSTVQRKTVREQELENNTQLFINTLNSQLRNTTLSYDFYDEYYVQIGEDLLTDLPTHILAIDSSDGVAVFRKSGEVGNPWSGVGSDLEMCFSKNNSQESCLADSAVWDVFSYGETTIEDLKFYPLPAKSPFVALTDGTYQNNQQPMVTAIIKTSYAGAREGEKLELTAQTTFSFKDYQR